MAEFCPLYKCTNNPTNTNVNEIGGYFNDLEAVNNVNIGQTFPS